jgi:hypothetical protein
VYELIPNLSVVFNKQPLRTDQNGFRGTALSQKRPDICIVGLGDSVMFGWGVKEEDTYMAVLGELLKTRYPTIQWSIINTAVPGYNTTMEIETLKEKGLHYTPDLVIINYMVNDLALPIFIRKKANYFSLRKSFLKEKAAQLIRRNKVNPGLATLDIPRWPYVPDKENIEKVPEQYRDMIGIEAYEKAMQELKRLSEQYRFDVLVLSHEKPPKWVRTICAQLAFPLVESQPAWEKYVVTNNIANPKSAWQVFKGDPHPSAIAHEIIATSLLEYLVEKNQFSQFCDNAVH